MRTLSAGALVLIAALLALSPPVKAAPNAETGVFVVHTLPRASDQEPWGLAEASAAKGVGAGWASIYIDWKAMQPNGPDDALVVGQLSDRLASFKAQNLKVNVTFLGTPQWASGNANPYYPPTDPQMFGAFVSKLAAQFGDKIDGYELGNEPDGGIFWLPGPDPAKYAGYANAGIAAIKAADPSAVKFAGGLVGGNAQFLEQALNAGLAGFDAIAFHSGTACKLDPPTYHNYKDTYIQATSTTAYRELIHVLKSRGLNATVADTAAGWSTSAGMCNTPGIAADKKGGVTEAQQTQFLREYFGCIESDPELKYVFIFSLFDLDAGDKWDHRMGLLNFDRTPKPSYGAMKEIFTSAAKPGYAPGGTCGGYVDHKPPTVELKIGAPLVNGVHYYADNALPIVAKGTDEHPVIDIDLFYDKQSKDNEIATKTENGVVDDSDGWFGAKKLGLGDHTIIAIARDEVGNASTPAIVKIKKVKPTQMPLRPTKLTAKVKRVRGKKVTISGNMTWEAGIGKPTGHVRVQFKKGKFVSKYSFKPTKSFSKTYTLRKPGKWKVSVFYVKTPPFQASKAKAFSVRVR